MTAALGAAVAGWGMALPARTVSNFELAERVDTSDEWISDRTGIRERRVAGDGETTASLAIEAGAAAIKCADLSPAQIGCCIVATCTPEQPLPATAAFVQDALGTRGGAFDLDAACAGFVYSLVVGASMVAGGVVESALIIGSETITRLVDFDDRSTCVLFGDGAGAVVLTTAETKSGLQPGLVAWDLGCDGSAAPLLGVLAGGSRRPIDAEALRVGAHRISMEGQEVYRRAVRALVDSTSLTLAKAGATAAEVALFVPHQANVRIIEAAASRLGIPMDRVMVNIDRYGNTSAASVPIALAEAADAGRIESGDLVLMSGFGAGMAWATALVRWGR